MENTLTFKDIGLNERFIGFPLPGDDAGHGGYKGTHWIFKKIDEHNAVNIKFGTTSRMPESMSVIKVE